MVCISILEMLPTLLPRLSPSDSCDCRTTSVRRGHYYRKSDRAKIQRFLCTRCGRSFSEASFDRSFRQKKRQYNNLVFKMLTAGYSQRRLAFDLNLNRKTVVRKFRYLGLCAKQFLAIHNLRFPKVRHMQFDDMESSIHTKLKPCSITLAVEHGTRRILGFRVSDMPAKGKLAKLSVKKYGQRKDERGFNRKELFCELKPLIAEDALIRSDQNPHYPADVKLHFPNCSHKTFKGRRGCVVGQGELKRGGYDPLYSLNHTCAMLRANINRLVRRTWCTTKLKERLDLHIALYVLNHNLRLIDQRTSPTIQLT